MKWNKSTRLALYAAVELAQAQGELVTVGSVAQKYKVSTHHLAKVFQQLARSGIAQAVLGVGGGYRLARSPKEITLLDVVEVLEGKQRLDRCMVLDGGETCDRTAACRLKGVFDEIEQQAVFTLQSVRLSTFVGEAKGHAGGRDRTAASPPP